MLIPQGWQVVEGLFCGFGSRQQPEPARSEVARLGFSDVVTVQQVHGREVVAADLARGRSDVRADCIVVESPGVIAAVRTADCVPLLLLEVRGGRPRWAAAVHAGWRGTVAGVAVAAIAHARERGIALERMEAVLGPAIGMCCYDVGDDVVEPLSSLDLLSGDVFRREGGACKIDLRRINALLLERAGLRREAIRIVGPCTRCDSGHYFSYRRDPSETGRQLSWIGWADQAR